MEDAAELSKIAQKIFEDTFSEYNTKEDMDLYCAETFSYHIQKNEIINTGKGTIICECNKEIIGYAQVNWNAKFDKIDSNSQAEIQRFYIKKNGREKVYHFVGSTLFICKTTYFLFLYGKQIV